MVHGTFDTNNSNTFFPVAVAAMFRPCLMEITVTLTTWQEEKIFITLNYTILKRKISLCDTFYVSDCYFIRIV